MAEGGYDPETTNPFDPHGDDHDNGDDDENIPLLPFSKEKPPSHKYPWSSTPVQHSSTSVHHNPSFVDTPSGKIFGSRLEQERYKTDERIQKFFPNSNRRKFFAKIEDGLVKVKLKGINNVWYPIINEDGKVIIEENIKFPKTLRVALGKTAFEIALEKFRENTEENDKDNEEITELREQRENATISEQGEIDRRIEEAEARIEGRNQENEAIEERLTLRQRIKAIFKKYGFTAFAVASSIGIVIGVIVSSLKAGLTNVAKGVGNGLKALGKKLGEILPGMIGAIASFLFRTAGEVIGFLAKNAWLLIVGLVVLAVEQFKKKSR